MRARLDDGRANLAAGTSWLWASPKMVGRGRRPVRRRGRPDLARQRHRDVAARRDSLVLLGDPQQLDQPLQGAIPPGADRSALAHVLGDDGDDAARPRACSSRRPGACIPDLCAFTSEVFYDDRLEPEPTPRASSGVARRATLADGVGTAAARGRRRSAPTTSRRSRRRRSRRSPATLVEGGSDLGRPSTATSARVGWDGRPDRRAVQRPGRRDPAPAAAGGAGRHGRQVPGPGGADQHLLDDDLVSPSWRRAGWTSCTAATASTSRRRGRGASAVVVASPDLFRVRARTPEQMRLANAFCRFAGDGPRVAGTAGAVEPSGSDPGPADAARLGRSARARPTPRGPARRPRPRRAGRARRRCARPGRRPARRSRTASRRR